MVFTKSKAKWNKNGGFELQTLRIIVIYLPIKSSKSIKLKVNLEHVLQKMLTILSIV